MDRGLTIVIAEDNEDDAHLLEHALRAIGLTNPVHILSDGAEVIEYLRGGGKYEDRQAYPFPTVLFTDVKMPRLSGFDVLRWMREHPDYAVVPAMVFSASNMDADIKLAYQLGANAYLVKPTLFEDLKKMLQATYEFWLWCAKPSVPAGSTAAADPRAEPGVNGTHRSGAK